MGTIWGYLSKNVPMKEQWRYGDENVFTSEKKDQLLNDIDDIIIPEQSQALNLCVIGYKASGKSSLINTLKTVVRNSGHLCTVVPAYGKNRGCTSRKLNGVTLKTLSSGKKICVYDTFGIQREPLRNDDDKNAALIDDLKKTIAGHVMHNYEFQEISIQEESDFYRRPTLSDRMHCVIFVINAENVQELSEYKTLLMVQQHLANENVPLRLVLTYVDKLHPGASDKLSGIFHNRLIYDKVRNVKEIFSLQDCHILPIANYVDSDQPNLNQDVLALLALDNILQETLAAFQ